MNILLVSDVSIWRVIGGAERVLYEQATRLAKREHNVHILTRRLTGHASNHEVIQGVNEWRYRADISNPIVFLKTTLTIGRKLFERLHRQYLFDCINLHQPFSALAVIRSPESLDIRRIYTCHSLSPEEYISRNPKPEKLSKRLTYQLNVQGRKWIEKKAIEKSHKVITLSKFTRDKLIDSYGVAPKKMALIPGGVDLERFCPADDPMQIRKRLSIPADRFILFSVRNLVPRMGLDRLILAMKEVASRIPDAYLVLGGTGPLRNSIMALSRDLGLEDHIRFSGFIPEEDLPDYYRAADLFVLPTIELEGFGLVTLEALASGTPVLGTPVGGTSEILRQLGPHFLFKDTSSESLAELIIEIAELYRTYPGKQLQDSFKCRRFVEENYSWDKNVQKTEALYRDLIWDKN